MLPSPSGPPARRAWRGKAEGEEGRWQQVDWNCSPPRARNSWKNGASPSSPIREDGLPHQTVMWYALRGDTILLNEGRARTRSRHLRRDPRLSVCIEDEARYVTLTGTCELQSDDQSPPWPTSSPWRSATRAEQQGLGILPRPGTPRRQSCSTSSRYTRAGSTAERVPLLEMRPLGTIGALILLRLLRR